MRKRSFKIPIIIIVLVVILLFVFIPTPYLIIKPGTAEDLSNFIDVHEIDYENDGVFYLVTIAQQGATAPWLIYGILNPYIDIAHREQVIPPGLDMEEYRRILDRWMEESQLLSKIIALRRSGYEDDLQIEGEGIGIQAFVEDSPADEILQVGDVILKINGEEVYFADQVLALVQDRQIGDLVELTIQRDNETFDVAIPTVPHVDSPQTPALGVYITALGEWEVTLPMDIDIKTGNISGPSAGVMFVLEIINQLMPGDLAGGKDIAGTGTINYFEDVGEIGGVKQKVVAAEKAGADYFIVPEGNYNEAVDVAKDLEVISVKNLQDVIDFLTSINMASSYDSLFSFLPDHVAIG